MYLGVGIKEIRKRLGLSQAVLSQRSGVTQAALSKIENSKLDGGVTLKKICKALDVPLIMIVILSLQDIDVAEKKRFRYATIYPLIQELIFQLVDGGGKNRLGLTTHTRRQVKRRPKS